LLARSPALAGLFFSLVVSAAEAPQLSASGQLYFRRFVEQFTPLVVRNEKHNRRLNFRWDSANRDCAGLVRYVFHEALSQHRESFFAHYPELSRLGNYAGEVEFSNARRYWNAGNQTAPDLLRHARYLGRNTGLQKLKTGDILYYESAEWRIRHVMLVVRSGKGIFLVYHTGDQRDELRLRTVEDMRIHDVPQWHPDADNPVFRGVYRPVFLQ
jgi:uncharacterized protein YfaT (DUF1175 family)